MALTQDASNPSSKKRSKIFIWVIVIALIVGGALYYKHYQQAKTASSDGAADGPQSAGSGKKFDPSSKPAPVAVAKAKTQYVNIYLDALGTVTPRNTVTVKTRVDGQLLKLYFTEGQIVKAGDLLAQIDPQPYQVALAQAEGQLFRDKALLENTSIDLERYKTLLSQDSISKQQADTQEALVRQYRGAVAVDQALVDSAKLQLSYARITAPLSGRVGLRQVDPGNMIHSTDTNGIVTITQLQPITALFNVPEDNLPAINQRVSSGEPVNVDAFDRAQQAKLASGKLLTTDNQIDTTTGTIKLRAIFKNDDAALFPNQFINVKILVDVQKDAVVIPVAGLQRGSKGDYVYVLVNGDSVTVRPVKSGYVDGDVVVIARGLDAGEVVVTDGTDKLREGAKVKPMEPVAADATAGKHGHGGHHKRGGQKPGGAE